MNLYMDLQCRNMVSSVRVFEQACDLAAQKDDGKIDRDEARQLKRIHDAAKKFCVELERVRKA